MKLNRLIALSTLSTLCLAAGTVASADPVTFEAPTPGSSARSTLMNATGIAFSAPQKSPLDEFDSLLNTMDSLPSMLFPSSIHSTHRIVAAGPHHAPTSYALREDHSPSLASIFTLDLPVTLRDKRIEAANLMPEGHALSHATDLIRVSPSSSAVAASAGYATSQPAVAYGAEESALSSRSVLQSGYIPPQPPSDLERLENSHRLFSNNPDVPFANYDQDDHAANDQTADAFQNDLFVPGRPFPMQEQIYQGNAADYTTDLEVAGGLALIAFLSIHGHHRPVPETSSVLGLSVLCAGGSLALLRARRCATV